MAEDRTIRLAPRSRCLEYYGVCNDLLREVQHGCTQVKFNHRQCQVVATQYLESMCSLSELEFDRVVISCEESLRELMRVMRRGVKLVSDCLREDWWESVLIRSECSSFSTHIVLHLDDFISCVNTVKLSFAEATGDLEFSVPLKPDRTHLSALIEDATQENNAYLLGVVKRIVEVGGVTAVKKLTTFFMQARSINSELSEVQSIGPCDVVFPPGENIGVGASGRVKIATWSDKTSVTVKFMADAEQVRSEAMLLEFLAHPNVVKLIGIGLPKDSDKGQYLVLELMRTSLRNLINTRSDGGRKPPFEIYTAIDIMLQIAEALRHFHEHSVLHCDVKANNVLINDDDLTALGNVQIKVTDFGLARKIESSKPPVSLEYAGTPGWMAPELFEIRRTQGVPYYTAASDVYAFAVTCFEILSGQVPFEDVHDSDTLRAKLVAGDRPSLPDIYPQYLRQCIRMCWATNPEDRPSFGHICEMLKFFRGFCIRYRPGSATALASVNEHDAWELSHFSIMMLRSVDDVACSYAASLYVVACGEKVCLSQRPIRFKLLS
ncbi:hypothetical protein KC19_2G216000 [Ceratodon purpureus]|uniref:Protein kinase domain-containing protein n=1 Tax=Ceratodon purpureus TaxID=3225 RepID=A0A8T0J0D7_CERPU|nr:hypothetical protein KC19_2G216000 [Ceratodon purpureus]